ncbi:MAG: hypothetical protein FWC56_01775, partial [Phycisphaerae bacterium]|nr:hypothetical protein [Phycisphaerae bacterium]
MHSFAWLSTRADIHKPKAIFAHRLRYYRTIAQCPLSGSSPLFGIFEGTNETIAFAKSFPRHCEPHLMGRGNPAFLLDYLSDCFL